ncbi:MAG: 4Fe-4S binding protein [Dehalococcoidia bacterium]|jgi:NAD-dependent dihydropyrimidine dehydrogenase PreA subunit
MSNTVYAELAFALNARGTTIPAVLCDEYFALVQFLLTPEEAAIACAMPLGFATAKEIAAEMETKDVKTLVGQLDRMGDKGLVHTRWRDGKKLYEFPPLIPGLVEFQFMSGRIDERSKKMVELLNDYRWGAKKAVLSGASLALNSAAKSKKIVVDCPVLTTFTVLPYNDVLGLIADTEHISVGTCTCKQMGNLSGKPCSRPSDVCMMFGESALHAIVKGFARKLSKKEAIEKLDIAEEAGLVHNYMNNPGHYSNFLCNCDQCHCMVLRGIKKAPVPNSMIIARYSIEIDEQRCTGCGACIERCQMEALRMQDGKPVKEPERCIGCGLCKYVCQPEALTLRPLEAAAIPLRKCW